MPHAHDRIEFAPPRQGGTLRALSLAMLAHLFLVAALTWGVSWKRTDSSAGFEAELWSNVPQQAAPKEVLAPPPPPPPPPVQAPEQVKPPPPVPREADIAVEQEKKRKELEKKREQEQEELLEKQKQAKSAQDKLELDKEKREQLEKDKKQQAAQTALEKKLKEAEARKQEADAAADRQRNLERMAGLAGGTGAPGATGSAQQSSGPSSGYGGRVKARVKPNIVFTDDVAGNPATEVEVRTSPDGTIVGTRVTKSSGVRAWDDAVVRALEKTEVMPRDTDGRVPTPMIITFRPKEMLN